MRKHRCTNLLDTAILKAISDQEFQTLLLNNRNLAISQISKPFTVEEINSFLNIPDWELQALITRAQADPWFKKSLRRGAAAVLIAALGFTAPISAAETFDDKIPDTWEEQYFTNADQYIDTDDPDGDNYSNMAEYWWDSDPTDYNSIPNQRTYNGTAFTLDPTNDTDTDGLPDDWESQHFYYTRHDEVGDYDMDGVINIEEFFNQTNPAFIPVAPSYGTPVGGEGGCNPNQSSSLFQFILCLLASIIIGLKPKRKNA